MERVQRRFNELTTMADQVAASKKTTRHQPEPSRNNITGHIIQHSSYLSHELDLDLFIQWQTSVLSLLERVFGTSSSTFQQFEGRVKASYNTTHAKFDALRAVFLSAKNDFEGGYLFDVANLIHASVFSSELDQAAYFLLEGYRVAAAVIGGSVLEATVRRLCESHDAIEVKDKATLSWYNDELKRVELYNLIVYRQVQAWADIRNAAAHGHPEKFDDAQVRNMIDGIRDFVAKYVR